MTRGVPKWKCILAAWLGRAFDGLGGYRHTIAAIPFLRRLPDKPAVEGEVVERAGLAPAVFLVGWAGAVIAGVIAGRPGSPGAAVGCPGLRFFPGLVIACALVEFEPGGGGCADGGKSAAGTRGVA